MLSDVNLSASIQCLKAIINVVRWMLLVIEYILQDFLL